MGMGFAPIWLRQVSPLPLLHKTTLTTGPIMPRFMCMSASILQYLHGFGLGLAQLPSAGLINVHDSCTSVQHVRFSVTHCCS